MAEWPDVVCLVQIEAPPGPNTKKYRSNPGLAGGTFVTLVRESSKVQNSCARGHLFLFLVLLLQLALDDGSSSSL